MRKLKKDKIGKSGFNIQTKRAAKTPEFLLYYISEILEKPTYDELLEQLLFSIEEYRESRPKKVNDIKVTMSTEKTQKYAEKISKKQHEELKDYEVVIMNCLYTTHDNLHETRKMVEAKKFFVDWYIPTK